MKWRNLLRINLDGRRTLHQSTEGHWRRANKRAHDIWRDYSPNFLFPFHSLTNSLMESINKTGLCHLNEVKGQRLWEFFPHNGFFKSPKICWSFTVCAIAELELASLWQGKLALFWNTKHTEQGRKKNMGGIFFKYQNTFMAGSGPNSPEILSLRKSYPMCLLP